MHCRRMHHSLLHLVVSEFADVQAMLRDVSHASDVLFATIWVNLHTAEDRWVPVHTLIDQCSILSFISESLCQTLRTKRQRIDLSISGVAGMERGDVRAKVSLGLSDKSVPMISLTTYVLLSITAYTISAFRDVVLSLRS